MNARAGTITPFSLMILGVLMVLLASLMVFQTQKVSTTPVEMDLTSLFEPKSGELVMDQAPYLGGILGFIFRLLERLFRSLFGGFGFGGAATLNAGPAQGSASGSVGIQAESTNTSEDSGKKARKCTLNRRIRGKC